MSKDKDLAKRSQSWFIHATKRWVLNYADLRANGNNSLEDLKYVQKDTDN